MSNSIIARDEVVTAAGLFSRAWSFLVDEFWIILRPLLMRIHARHASADLLTDPVLAVNHTLLLQERAASYVGPHLPWSSR